MNDERKRENRSEGIVTQRLRDWGWTDDRDEELAAALGEGSAAERVGEDDAGASRAAFAAARAPARVIAQHRGEYRLMAPWGEATGLAPGRMSYRAAGRRELPAVGDWVLIEPSRDGPATIVEILPRRSQFVRRKAGTESEQQVIAANVDTAFIVSSLNQELRARRIERYLVAAWESGAMPVVVLTKADLCDDVEAAADPIRDVAAGAPVEVVSAVSGEGLESLHKWLQPRHTVVLIGSSGVGKSTLVNTLAGEQLLTTRDVRAADDKGRHTTTHREIFRLSDGALLLDTPGMRELGLVEADEGLGETFDEVAALAARCRFRDCSHTSEPDCAVRAAIAAGELSSQRWESYDKLQKEAAWEERRRDAGGSLAEKRKWKQIHKDLRKTPKKGS